MPVWRLTPVLCGAALTLAASGAEAQRLVSWTEAAGELGLGYPVPVPLASPLPFDGFRGYRALRARHFDLANTHGAITRVPLGLTERNRDIYMYIVSDPDDTTPDGRREGSVLIVGGVHAREWQSPEVVTGVMELLAGRSDDDYFHQYLIDSLNIAVIPVLNVDGFLQTQRFPADNYLDSDPDNPASSPRDGRMRRKNMRSVDQELASVGDHLLGIDLNRNNQPFWATSSGSSGNPQSLVYHGLASFSEAETLALSAAPDHLLPGADATTLGDRLRLFIDVHSFTRVLFPVATTNAARNANQFEVMQTLVRHNEDLPGGRVYTIQPTPPAGTGIGTTSEYFAHAFQVPSWTLELEPGLGGGAEYGGFGTNVHDGFILPEAEIARLRESMAASLAATAYHMTGPPAIQRIRIVDADSGALVFESRQEQLDVPGQAVRQRVGFEAGPLVPDRDYRMEITFDKPMRWLNESGEITVFPGQSDDSLDFSMQLQTDSGDALTLDTQPVRWPTEPGFFGGGYARYRTDVALVEFRIVADAANAALIDGVGEFDIAIGTTDMVGFGLDTEPDSPVDWSNGDWHDFEHGSGQGQSGTADRSVAVGVVGDAQAEAFDIDAAVSGTWHALGRSGVGYIVEVLPDGRVVLAWAAYNGEGGQRWLLGIGEQRGNRIVADDMIVTSGARFGADFDSADVVRVPNAGSLELVFTGCNAGLVNFRGFGQSGRADDLVRTTGIAGVDCTGDGSVLPPLAFVSGSWHDPSHDGEGVTVHLLPDGRAIMYWYSYDPDGNQRWFIGVGTVESDGRIVIEEITTTSGAMFGNDFVAGEVVRAPFGEVVFDLGCDSGSMMYDLDDPEFGSGALDLIRLTRIAGAPPCP